MKFACAILVLSAVSLVGCVKTQATRATNSPTTRAVDTHLFPPILYHRIGGIAGTDDRVVIWPDGFVDVTGRLLPSASSRVSKERLGHLTSLFTGWGELQDEYSANVADAYIITISFGDKSVTASDLAPNLPESFRMIFTEIEAIAAQAAAAGAKPVDEP